MSDSIRQRTRSSTKRNAATTQLVSEIPTKQSNEKVTVSDEDLDGLHHEYEFGGPIGVTAMMICFPALFYYLYVSLYFYDGQYYISTLEQMNRVVELRI